MVTTRHILHIQKSKNKEHYTQLQPIYNKAKFTADGHMLVTGNGKRKSEYRVKTRVGTRNKIMKCWCDEDEHITYYRIAFKNNNELQKVKNVWEKAVSKQKNKTRTRRIRTRNRTKRNRTRRIRTKRNRTK